MGMCSHVVGIFSPPDSWIKMKAVWDACKLADIAIPEEVLDFFGGEEPDPRGVVSVIDHPCVSVYKDIDRNAEGFEIDLEKLPPGLRRIRFVNSW